MDVRPFGTSKCPHCAVTAQFIPAKIVTGDAELGDFTGKLTVGFRQVLSITTVVCSACLGVVVVIGKDNRKWIAFPRHSARPPLHPTVPQHIAQDYREAALVLEDSPKASAALSRRCLQALLESQGIKGDSIADQLKVALPQLPGYVAPFVDQLRKLGNAAAHPKPHATTGEIIDVQPDEAEWMLELLDQLFDHYYTKPAAANEKLASLTQKLGDGRKK